jgi:hypothetical protein
MVSLTVSRGVRIDHVGRTDGRFKVHGEDANFTRFACPQRYDCDIFLTLSGLSSEEKRLSFTTSNKDNHEQPDDQVMPKDALAEGIARLGRMKQRLVQLP